MTDKNAGQMPCREAFEKWFREDTSFHVLDEVSLFECWQAAWNTRQPLPREDAGVSDDAPMEFSKAEKITLDQLEEHLKKADDEDIVEITNEGAVRRRSATKPAPVSDDVK